MTKPLLFISCGQYTEKEKQLGHDIVALVREIRPDLEPYFAETITTADGLSANILNALNRSAGFICVMHRRGEIKTPEGKARTRGSVWIEQEIGIVAFIGHVLRRHILTLYYQEMGVSLEGIRSVLLMNPRLEFHEESQVLDSLRKELPTAAFNPFAEYDLIPELNYREKLIAGKRHDYQFLVGVKNVGQKRITDFQLDIMFPRLFLNQNATNLLRNRQRSTSTHDCFVIDSDKYADAGLYSGQSTPTPAIIDYFVDEDLLHTPNALSMHIGYALHSGDMPPKIGKIPFSKFQNF